MGAEDIKIVSKPSGNVQAKSMCSSTVYYPECTLCSLRLICEQFTTAHFYLVADDPHKSGMLKISVLSQTGYCTFIINQPVTAS